MGLEEQAAAELTAAGFIVQRDVSVETIGGRAAHIDLMAWTPSETGELVPMVVEVKRSKGTAHLADAASQLGYYAPLVKASDAYVYDGKWHRVSNDFSRTTPGSVPRPNGDVSKARAPKELVEQLVRKSFNVAHGLGLERAQAWESVLDSAIPYLRAKDFRKSHGKNSRILPKDIILSQISEPLRSVSAGRQNGPLIAEALVGAAQRVAGSGMYFTPKPLAQALARLLAPQPGWTVADPFCGMGTLLQAVHEYVSDLGFDCALAGGELNAQMASDARRLLELANVPATVITADSIERMPASNLDGVVTNPPMSAHLPGMLRSGIPGSTYPVAIEAILSSLKDGGRAVVVTAPVFLFGSGPIETFRRKLAENARIVSIIQLPGGALLGTNIACAILVIEKSRPSETLVAQLDEDWSHQLSDQGAFLHAYKEHLENRI